MGQAHRSLPPLAGEEPALSDDALLIETLDSPGDPGRIGEHSRRVRMGGSVNAQEVVYGVGVASACP